jgi:hypothetical protein
VAVSETAPPPPPTDPRSAPARSLIEIAGTATLLGLAFAGVVGVIAVIDAESRPEGFGVGIGIALLIFLGGATIACAFACLVRQRMERVALAAIGSACLSIDLVVLAIWLDIEHEAYAKTAGLAFVWSFFGLLVLTLALAVVKPQRLALALYAGAITAAAAGGVISTWLVLRSGEDDIAGGATPFGALPIGDDALLQVLGAMLVLLAAFWFGALAASRLPDQTLKRTLTTSPSSTT